MISVEIEIGLAFSVLLITFFTNLYFLRGNIIEQRRGMPPRQRRMIHSTPSEFPDLRPIGLVGYVPVDPRR
jgi:hypothetical protein